MPTAVSLEAEPLLAPLSGQDPAGAKLSLGGKKKLDEDRTDRDPDRDFADLPPDDPMRANASRKPANWKAVLDFGRNYLTASGKDLQVAVRMVEAASQTDHFAGVRDGLRLLRTLCETCWDRMHPRIADDPENELKAEDGIDARADLLKWLDDPLGGARFPSIIRGMSFLPVGEKAVSFQSLRPTVNKAMKDAEPPDVTMEMFRGAVRAASEDQVQYVRNVADNIAESLEELRTLISGFEERALADLTRFRVQPEMTDDQRADAEEECRKFVSGSAPGMTELRRSLEDCRDLAGEILQQRSKSAPDEPESVSGGFAGNGVAIGTAGIARSREEVYARIAQLLDVLEKMEPHSPVPYLLKRAVEMRDLSFGELFEVLTRDGGVVNFIRNEIRPGGGSGESS